jgi:hypothetical protein
MSSCRPMRTSHDPRSRRLLPVLARPQHTRLAAGDPTRPPCGRPARPSGSPARNSSSPSRRIRHPRRRRRRPVSSPHQASRSRRSGGHREHGCAASRRRPWRRGLALGFAVGSARPAGEPTRAPTTATCVPATRPARRRTAVVGRPAASSACLETARRRDELIGLLIANRRSRAADLLMATPWQVGNAAGTPPHEARVTPAVCTRATSRSIRRGE